MKLSAIYCGGKSKIDGWSNLLRSFFLRLFRWHERQCYCYLWMYIFNLISNLTYVVNQWVRVILQNYFCHIVLVVYWLSLTCSIPLLSLSCFGWLLLSFCSPINLSPTCTSSSITNCHFTYHSQPYTVQFQPQVINTELCALSRDYHNCLPIVEFRLKHVKFMCAFHVRWYNSENRFQKNIERNRLFGQVSLLHHTDFKYEERHTTSAIT